MTDEPSDKEEGPDEIEARLAEIQKGVEDLKAGRRMPSLDDGHQQLESRLKQIETSAQQARERHVKAMGASEREQQIRGESGYGLGVGLLVAYTIVGVPLGGALVGWLIDRGLGTDGWKGGLTLAI